MPYIKLICFHAARYDQPDHFWQPKVVWLGPILAAKSGPPGPICAQTNVAGVCQLQRPSDLLRRANIITASWPSRGKISCMYMQVSCMILHGRYAWRNLRARQNMHDHVSIMQVSCLVILNVPKSCTLMHA